MAKTMNEEKLQAKTKNDQYTTTSKHKKVKVKMKERA